MPAATLTFAPEPARLSLKSTAEAASLRQLVESRCPSLLSKCRSPWWLRSGHLQTIYAVVGDFSKQDQVWYQRRLLRLLDGGTLGLDFTPADPTAVPRDAPIIVVNHGLTGGSHEPYVRAILAPACTPVSQGGLGYRAVVVNFRGCSGVPITSPKFYTAAQTDDLRQALMFISNLYPDAPLLGLGFSIGGNVMMRYLAEEGPNSRLSSGCILGCPWDLVTNNDHLLHTLLGRTYLRGMGTNVTTLFAHHHASFLTNPTASPLVPAILRLKRPTLTDFDHIFTCHASSSTPFPFPSFREYYTWASSHDIAHAVRVPVLTINAADDPIVRRVQTPDEKGRENRWVVCAVTPMGGHLGWFAKGMGKGKGKSRWTTKPVLEWMELLGRDVVRESGPEDDKMYTDEDGFLRVARRPTLGCKEVPGGGIIDGNRPESELFQGL